MADAAGDEADEHLSGPWLLQVEFLDDQRLAEFLEDGGADLHGPGWYGLRNF
jgi:hypothetical protein